MTSRANTTAAMGWGWFALLALACGAAHLPALDAPFVFDDCLCIEQNPSIISLANWKDVLWPPTDGSGVSGRPLVNLSLALNYAVGGLVPRGYHVFNIVAHLVAACLLFSVTSRCLHRAWRESPAMARSAHGVGFAVALLWVVHPLQTESVAFTIQRTEILGGLFYLLTLWGFVRSADAEHPGRWQSVAVISCLAGVAAKEIVFTAPLLVMLLDRALWSGSFGQAWRSRRRLYLGLLASWCILALILYQMGGTRGGAAGFGASGVPWWAYFLRQWEAITTYLKLVAWPNPLILDYGCGLVMQVGDVAGRGLLLFAVGGIVVWGLIRNTGWGVVGAAFFLILGPSSSVMPLPAQTMAEHRMYLPLAAILVLAVVGLWRLWGQRSRWLLWAAVGALIVISAARSLAYLSPLQLWRQAMQAVPENVRALSNAGDVYFQLGRYDEAAACHRGALKQDPLYRSAWSGLGNIALRRRDFEEAIRCYRQVLALDPNYSDALSNLGMALWAGGRTEEGLAQLQHLIRTRPKFADAHFNLGTALLFMGRNEAAAERFQEAIRLRPTLAEAYHNLGVVMLRTGRPREAEQMFLHALRLRPDYPDAVQNLATARAQR
jgi:tetratricopeptide (TPR) repeat protein